MDKPKHVKATWDAVAHRVFLDVCIEEVNANNRPVQVLNAIGYKNLVENFNKRTKRNYDRKQMKNRWETLKKDYTVWKGLIQHASGLGRDPITHTIDASDDWWTHEIQVLMFLYASIRLLSCYDVLMFLYAFICADVSGGSQVSDSPTARRGGHEDNF
jgi:hypothetical protein